MKKVKFQFLILEIPFDDYQKERVLTCLEFDQNSMRLSGKSRFNEFKAKLSMPQDGSIIDVDCRIIKSNKNSFSVEFVNQSDLLKSKLAFWF